MLKSRNSFSARGTYSSKDATAAHQRKACSATKVTVKGRTERAGRIAGGGSGGAGRSGGGVARIEWSVMVRSPNGAPFTFRAPWGHAKRKRESLRSRVAQLERDVLRLQVRLQPFAG